MLQKSLPGSKQEKKKEENYDNPPTFWCYDLLQEKWKRILKVSLKTNQTKKKKKGKKNPRTDRWNRKGLAENTTLDFLLITSFIREPKLFTYTLRRIAWSIFPLKAGKGALFWCCRLFFLHRLSNLNIYKAKFNAQIIPSYMGLRMKRSKADNCNVPIQNLFRRYSYGKTPSISQFILR